MLRPVILAGGSGTRLWPLSRPEHPKPLTRPDGEHSMLQATVLRAALLRDPSDPIIVCGKDHYPLVSDQLAEIGVNRFRAVLEPVGRSTAPAAAAAALLSAADDLLLVLPADHAVRDTEAFVEVVERAMDAARAGWLVTFGVTPDRPETGYGYIEHGPSIGLPGVIRIASFREKPDRPTARRYLESGRYSWNSGMFLFRAGTFVDELASASPGMVRQVRAALGGEGENGPAVLDEQAFSACPDGSIDRTVMERTSRGAMAPLEAGWSDLGSWAALWERAAGDGRGNVVAGPAELRSVSSSYVSAGERPVLVLGLDRVIVVDTGDAVLVASMDKAQDVKPPEVSC
ncbi:MAG: mannose-1-phosphate guanylyltransferase [bacterium]|nr:mannose-1-phosphate guanylyltransferase [bacterium]MDE0353953.1 mannose-1-phosphate guanylyltransferase [bacterium]